MKFDFLKTWPILFKDKKIEDRFAEDCLNDDIRKLTIFKTVLAFLLIFFIKNDYMFFGNSEQFRILLILRLFVVLWTGISIPYIFKNRKPSVFRAEAIIWGAFLMIASVYINYTRPSSYFTNAIIDIFLVFALYTLLPLNAHVRLFMCVPYSVANCMIFLFVRTGISDIDINTILVSYFTANSIGFFGALRSEKYRRIQYKALIDEISHKEEIKSYAVQLEDMNRELNAYNHTVAHDLKSPIAGIVGNLDLLNEILLKEPEKNAERIEQISEILKAAYNLVKIIDELLLLASIKRVDEIEIKTLDMKSIINVVNRRLAHEVKKTKAVLKISNEWFNAKGYEAWIEEVWANYISNGIKYGGNPPILEMGSDDLKNGYIKFWIKDNGAGIREEFKKNLFNEFVKDASHASGQGLGLSIVKRIITKLNGECGIDETGVDGSSFYFTLPVA